MDKEIKPENLENVDHKPNFNTQFLIQQKSILQLKLLNLNNISTKSENRRVEHEKSKIEHEIKLIEILLEIVAEKRPELTLEKSIGWLLTVFGQEKWSSYILDQKLMDEVSNDESFPESKRQNPIDFINYNIQNYHRHSYQKYNPVNTVISTNSKQLKKTGEEQTVVTFPIIRIASEKTYDKYEAESSFYFINSELKIDEYGVAILTALFQTESLLDLLIAERYNLNVAITKSLLSEKYQLHKNEFLNQLVKIGIGYFKNNIYPNTEDGSFDINIFTNVFKLYDYFNSSFLFESEIDDVKEKWMRYYNWSAEDLVSAEYFMKDYSKYASKMIYISEDEIIKDPHSIYAETQNAVKEDRDMVLLRMYIQRTFINLSNGEINREIEEFINLLDQIAANLQQYQSTYDSRVLKKRAERQNLKPDLAKTHDSEISRINSFNNQIRNKNFVLSKVVTEFLDRNQNLKIDFPDLDIAEVNFVKGRNENKLFNFLATINSFDPENLDQIPVILSIIEKLKTSVSNIDLGESRYRVEIPDKIELSKTDLSVTQGISMKAWDSYLKDRINKIQPSDNMTDQAVDMMGELFTRRINLTEVQKEKYDKYRRLRELKIKTASREGRFFNTWSKIAISMSAVVLSYYTIVELGHLMYNLYAAALPKTTSQDGSGYNKEPDVAATLLGYTIPPQQSLFTEFKNIELINPPLLHEVLVDVDTLLNFDKQVLTNTSKEDYDRLKAKYPHAIEVKYLSIRQGNLPFPGGFPIGIKSDDKIELIVKNLNHDIVEITSKTSSAKNVSVLYLQPIEKFGTTLQIPYDPNLVINKERVSYQKTTPDFWTKSFKNQEFAIKIAEMQSDYNAKNMNDLELIDRLEILIKSQVYDFNNIYSNYSDIDKTGKEIIEGLKNQGIVCEHATFLMLYLYKTITRNSGGMISGVMPEKDGSFNTTNLHSVSLLVTSKGEYVISDPTPTNGPGISKLRQAVQKINSRNNNLMEFLGMSMLVTASGFIMFVLIPKAIEKEKNKFNIKVDTLGIEAVEANIFVESNFNALVELWIILQASIYGAKVIDQIYLENYLNDSFYSKGEYNQHILNNFLNNICEILFYKSRNKPNVFNNISPKSQKLFTQISQLKIQLDKQEGEKTEVEIILKDLIDKILM